MKRTLFALAIILLFTCQTGYCQNEKQITNGLYFITDPGKGPSVKALDGVEINLGEQLTTAPIKKIYFKSLNNDNTAYQLMLQKTNPFSDRDTLFALYVDGYCMRFNGSGSSNDQTFDISGQFDSAQAADVFTEFFHTLPLKRTHPHYALTTKYVPSKESFSTDEPLPVTLEITNVGTAPVTFQVGGKNRGERDNQFGFTAYDGMNAIPDTGNPVHFGGISFNKTLQPGETFTKEVDLRKWFTFPKAGTYEITGTYSLSFFDQALTDYFFVVWEDYATASFYLRINEP